MTTPAIYQPAIMTGVRWRTCGSGWRRRQWQECLATGLATGTVDEMESGFCSNLMCPFFFSINMEVLEIHPFSTSMIVAERLVTN